MKLEQFKEITKDLNVFCEIGVYFYDEYCRLQEQIEIGKTVILVEPAPPCVEDIESHIKGKENVTLYPAAIADDCGMTTIYFEGASAFISEIDGKAPVHQRNYLRPNIPEHRVPKFTFNCIDKGDIECLLIDTEGMEYFVLKWMISRPKLIIIETHFREYTNPYMQKIEDWMKENGYKVIGQDESDTAYALQ